MAYRFNPPPNWPITEPGWKPPAGWQPDPEWGPAPEGWEFWVDDSQSQTTEATQVTQAEPSAPEAPQPPTQVQSSAPASEAPNLAQAPEAPSAADSYAYSGTGSSNLAQSAPSATELPSWQANGSSTAFPEQPQKGILARFWWVGCIILIVLALLIAAIALIGSFFFSRDDGGEAQPADPAPTQSASASASDPSPSASDPTTDPGSTDSPSPSASPSSSDSSSVSPTPSESASSASPNAGGNGTVLPGPKLGPNPVSHEITTYRGKAKLTISMEWIPNDQVEAKLGDNVQPAGNGQYLKVVSQLEVTDGEVFNNPTEPVITTPYGGVIDYSSEVFGMSNTGLDHQVNYVPAGTTSSMLTLYDVKKVDGLVLKWAGDDSGQKWTIPVK